MALTKPIFLRPTMGDEPTAYQMLTNVVSKGGSLHRRPCIRAVEMGYASSSADGDKFATIDDNKAFGPQWRFVSYTEDGSVFSGTANLIFQNPAADTTLEEMDPSHPDYDVAGINASVTLEDGVGDKIEYVFVLGDTNVVDLSSSPPKVYVGIGAQGGTTDQNKTDSRAAFISAINTKNGLYNKQYPPLRIYATSGGLGIVHLFQLIEGTAGATTITYNDDASSPDVFYVMPSVFGAATGATSPTLTLEVPGGLSLTAANLPNHVSTDKFVEVFDTSSVDGGEASKALIKSVSLVTSGDHAYKHVTLVLGKKLLGTTSQANYSYQIRGINFHGTLLTNDKETQDSRYLYNVNTVVEGIDCEIINGVVVAIYLGKLNEKVMGITSTDLHFYHSYHHAGDPRMGRVRDITQYGSTKDDSPSNWYKLANFWSKRILPTFSDYMITGHGVGPSLVGGSVTSTINRGDSLSLFSGYEIKMFVRNSVFETAIPRADPWATIYCIHSPTNAFGHLERQSGQVIWYGFIDGEKYELLSEIPAETVLIMASPSDIPTERDTVYVRPYDIWYSEPAMPLSLSIVGLFPLNINARSPEIVGMADYKTGTAIFSHDSIHFMRGVGADTASNAASRIVIKDGIGADSRWSIKAIGSGVAFANTKGVFYLSDNGTINEIEGFTELFSGDGVSCGRGPSHPYLSGTASGKHANDNTIEGNADNVFDSSPWRSYKIDKSRLDRAVAGVWNGLYLLFVSLDSDPPGEDNRLCLCWNWIESNAASLRTGWSPGPTSVWLLPKNMGVRGWAYDGQIDTPYVMTRYGLARFEDSPLPDRCWVNEGPTESDADADPTRVEPFPRGDSTYANQGYGWRSSVSAVEPMPIVMAQSRWLPESGDNFVTANVIVQHETHNDHKLSVAESWSYTNDGDLSGAQSYTGGDSSNDMRIRVIGAQSDLLMSKGSTFVDAYNKMSFSESKIHALQNFMQRADFKAWRGRHSRHNNSNEFPSSTDNDGTARIPVTIRRASAGRSGFQSTRCKLQLSTSSTGKILNVQVLMEGVSPKGERA